MSFTRDLEGLPAQEQCRLGFAWVDRAVRAMAQACRSGGLADWAAALDDVELRGEPGVQALRDLLQELWGAIDRSETGGAWVGQPDTFLVLVRDAKAAAQWLSTLCKKTWPHLGAGGPGGNSAAVSVLAPERHPASKNQRELAQTLNRVSENVVSVFAEIEVLRTGQGMGSASAGEERDRQRQEIADLRARVA